MDTTKHTRRSRSRSPHRNTHTHRHRHRHSRSRSPPSHHHHHHHRRHRSPARKSTPPLPLPFNAPPLSRHAPTPLPAVFRDYLDIQKGLRLDTLSAREARGRYKRFVSHYNRGELARGWYERVVKESRGPAAAVTTTADTAVTTTTKDQEKQQEEKEDDSGSSEDELVGPFLPGKEPKRATAARPTFQDLELQKAQSLTDHASAQSATRAERKAERQSRAALLDELAPRADPGTFARRLEKRAERAVPPPDDGGEDDDAVLLGEGTEGFKMKKAALERKKNDRELRKEQLLQARIAEREERMAMHRVKEERTMAMLRTLAGRFQ